MKSETRSFLLSPGDDARGTPVRLLVVQAEEQPAVDASDEPMVMTFPHLIVREGIAFMVLSLVLVIAALAFDAPLEEIANPDKTPNPAKAPWYFLGLQELLHYYPPVVSGVAIPALLLIALAIIPYFRVNIERPPLFAGDRRRRLAVLWGVIAVLGALLAFTGAHPVWPILVPLWIVAGMMTASAFWHSPTRTARWARTRSITFWIFLWFLLSAASLTLVGIFFRGPGWSFTLPWRDGIFY